MRRLAILAALVLAASAVPAFPQTDVSIKDNYFAQDYIVITAGDSVSWTNNGDDRHTVTSYDGVAFDSSGQTESACDDANPLTTEDCLEPGEQFGPITFNETGTFHYYCKAHGNAQIKPDKDAAATGQPCGMCATVKVVEEREDKGAPTRKPAPTPKKETPRKSPSPSASPSPSPTVSPSGSPVASAGTEGGGAGGRVLLALLLLGGLGGAGWWTWKKYLA